MLQKTKNRLRDILIETEFLTELQQKLKSQKDLEENEHIKRAACNSISVMSVAVKTTKPKYTVERYCWNAG